MTLADFPAPVVDLWASNSDALTLYVYFQTQWRVGPNGPIGLDYTVILHELDRRKLDTQDYDDLMDCIRQIESAALTVFQKS